MPRLRLEAGRGHALSLPGQNGGNFTHRVLLQRTEAGSFPAESARKCAGQLLLRDGGFEEEPRIEESGGFAAGGSAAQEIGGDRSQTGRSVPAAWDSVRGAGRQR